MLRGAQFQVSDRPKGAKDAKDAVEANRRDMNMIV
jgi:hypothetical protein